MLQCLSDNGENEIDKSSVAATVMSETKTQSVEITATETSGASTQTLPRQWLFKVQLTIDAYQLHPGDCVCVTGSCHELGAWRADASIALERDEDTDIWSKTILLPASNIQYRYCICTVIDGTRKIVRLWETNVVARNLNAVGSRGDCDTDEFGYYEGVHHVDRGWLSHDTCIQLKLFNNPITLYKPKLAGRKIYVKVTPVCLLKNQMDSGLPETLDESLSMDTQEQTTPVPEHTLTEVASLNRHDDASDAGFHLQEQFGIAYHENDFVIFQISVLQPANVTYLIDYYVYSSRATEDEPPYHLGFSYLLPSALKNSEGQMVVPITSVKQRPLGQLSLEYLVIEPIAAATNDCDMVATYARHWKQSWSGLDVAHRGSGANFYGSQRCADVRENTIASLKTAVSHGADFVEFDVQLSKDLVPVVYHDFHVMIAMKHKRKLEEMDMLELPVKDLTLEQLHLLKVYHVQEGINKTPRFFDEHLDDHQPFPTLQQVLADLDPHVGFNIEVKWTMKLKDGSFELYHPIDLNLYLDNILRVVLQHGGQRRIIFSCFHPDICTMMRLKQNKYPVMFLTQGKSDLYPAYHDPRCLTIDWAVKHACVSGFLGVSVHTEDLLRDPSEVKLALNAGLVIFCWGHDNNDPSTIKFLKQLGVHGVIYDKINEFNSKTVKESIFLVEARSQRNELLAIAEAAASELVPAPLSQPIPTSSDVKHPVAGDTVADVTHEFVPGASLPSHSTQQVSTATSLESLSSLQIDSYCKQMELAKAANEANTLWGLKTN